MTNATDRRTLDAAARREKGKRKSELQGVRYLMADPIGRALAWRYIDVTGADRAIPFQPNAMGMAHDAGTQKAGHWLLDEIREACPELEFKMRAEAKERAKLLDLIEENEE